MALGSRQLSRMHAIVARLAAIEELAGMNMLCSDKTGTLTLNKMAIQEDCPLFQENISRDDVIMFAALAAKVRCNCLSHICLVFQCLRLQCVSLLTRQISARCSDSAVRTIAVGSHQRSA